MIFKISIEGIEGMSTTINKKINHIFLLLGKLVDGQELYAQDMQLQEELFGESGREAQERSLRRYLNDIHILYSHMVVIEKKTKEFQDRKVTVYRVAGKRDVSDVLKFFLEQKSDLTWIVQMLHEQDPSLIRQMEKETVSAIENELEEDKDIFLFSSQPFEIFTTDTQKRIFANLKTAVKNHEYRTIYTIGNETNPLKNVKCLKIIYSQNNWYIAVEIEKEVLKLIRIKFIFKVEYSKKNSYKKGVLEKYKDYFLHFENPMTLPCESKKLVVLKVYPPISKYFRKEMKPYFKSQKHLAIHDDGSIEFSIEYTQSLEILPFIKRWLPDIEILSPKKLRDELLEELIYSVKKMTK